MNSKVPFKKCDNRNGNYFLNQMNLKQQSLNQKSKYKKKITNNKK